MAGFGISIFPLVFFRTNFTIKEGIICIFLIMIYSLMCDLDHRISKLTWWSLTFLTFANLISYFYFTQYHLYFLCCQLVLLFLVNLPHRGFTHSLSFGAIVVLPLFYFASNYLIILIAALAFWSHLIADKIPFKIK